MKCIKKGDTIQRVDNKRALEMVDKGWSFCSKSEWKAATRSPKKEDKPSKEVKKTKKKASKKKVAKKKPVKAAE